MLMRSFTKREKIVMLVLALALIVGFYFLAIHYPVKTRLEEIELEKAEVDEQTMIASAMLANYNKMKTELEEIFAEQNENLTVMPEYDNKQTLIYYFNSVFAETAPNLQFSQARIEGNIASRSISFNFTADSFDSARSVLELLTGTGFRCSMDNITISPTEGDLEHDELRVSGNIVFYELVK